MCFVRVTSNFWKACTKQLLCGAVVMYLYEPRLAVCIQTSLMVGAGKHCHLAEVGKPGLTKLLQ